jgi:hypothetical protein
METYGVQMKGVLPWSVSWARCRHQGQHLLLGLDRSRRHRRYEGDGSLRQGRRQHPAGRVPLHPQRAGRGRAQRRQLQVRGRRRRGQQAPAPDAEFTCLRGSTFWKGSSERVRIFTQFE